MNLDELIENARMGTKWVVQEYLAPKKPVSQMTIGEQDKVKKKIKEFILEISPFTDEADITDIVSSLSSFFDKNWLGDIRKQGKKGMNEVEINEWDKFLKEVTNGNKKRQKLLKQFAGYLLLPDCRFQKALMLKGEGSNGKSVFVNVLSRMLGGSQGYVSFVEPSKLVKDFRLMPFKNSWVNISSDTENDLRGSEGVFKKIVAGENLEDAYKFHSPFSFPTRSKMIMCCNRFPTITDTSDGFMRRFLIVDFPMHYVDADKVVPNTNKRPLDVNLEQKLLKELPGIFNWALEGLQELLAQDGFTETDEQERLINAFIFPSVLMSLPNSSCVKCLFFLRFLIFSPINIFIAPS